MKITKICNTLMAVGALVLLSGCASTSGSSSFYSYQGPASSYYNYQNFKYGNPYSYRYRFSAYNNPFFYNRINYYPGRYFYPYGRSVTVRRNFYYSKW